MYQSVNLYVKYRFPPPAEGSILCMAAPESTWKLLAQAWLAVNQNSFPNAVITIKSSAPAKSS